ncbi:MAG: DUF2142 domain-containing protein [Eubacteriaceae bacterium]|nr:DUF2142 domain-containing protein [Eubacteriaceae bacterium]
MTKKVVTGLLFALILVVVVPVIGVAGRIEFDGCLILAAICFCVFWIFFFFYRAPEENENFFKQHRMEMSFICFCFFFYFAWSVLIPYNQAPDEQMRYWIPLYIFRHNALPVGNETEIVNIVWGQSYAFQPILAYQIQAIAMEIASAFGMAEDHLFYAARLVNVLISTGTITIAIMIGQKLFTGRKIMLFAGLIGLWPMFAFISAYVNNDALGFFAAMLIVYAWLVGRERQWDLRACSLLGIGMSVCLLSYYNAYGFLFCSAFIYAADFFIHRKAWSWKRFVGYGLIMLAICAVLAGWWFVRSALLHNGDFLGLSTSNEMAEELAQPQFKPSQIKTPQNSGLSFFQMLVTRFNHQHGWIVASGISLMGVFGSFNIAMGIKNYIFLFSLLASGFLLFLIAWWQTKRRQMTIEDWVWGITMILAAIFPVALCLYYSYTSDYQPQGRYFLSSLIPVMIAMSYGFIWFDQKINGLNVLTERHWHLPVPCIIVAVEMLSVFSALCKTLFAVYAG